MHAAYDPPGQPAGDGGDGDGGAGGDGVGPLGVGLL